MGNLGHNKQPEGGLKRLHLGCGLSTPKGWINLDGSWNARLAKYRRLRKALNALHVLPARLQEIRWSADILIHDVRAPLPFPNDSMEVIYASHLLEHLYFDEAKRLMGECFRVLQPGGVFRAVVPDLGDIVLEYVSERRCDERLDEGDVLSPADRLNERLLLRSRDPPSKNTLYRIYTALTDFHSHKWMYDADSLSLRFTSAGFVEVQQRQFHQSAIEGIDEVEEAGRVLNGAGICIEGAKPIHTPTQR